MIDAGTGALARLCASSRSLGFAALASVALAGAFHVDTARAADNSLDVREIKVRARHTFSYTCANGSTFKVSYFNAANGQSFALVPVEGRKMLFVGVIAASGVRYVADRYTWWTKGPGADLYDTTSGDSAKPVLAGYATIMR